MKVLIVGAGGVGGYYGGRLAEAGHDVLVVARGEHGRVIAERGLTLQTPERTRSISVRVVTSVDQVEPASIELAIVAVKAPNLAEVAAGIGRALETHGVAIPLLNGLDSEQQLAQVIGEQRVVGGIAQVASEIDRPGHIRVRADGRIVLAPLANAQLEPVEALAKLLSEAGIPCVVRDDLSQVLWNKLLWNAPFNALCALTRLPAGAVLQIPELRAVVARAIAEVAAVARASGIGIRDTVVEALLSSTEREFADSVPSMLQDVLRNKPTEVDALQGAVVRRGQKLGVPTPTLSVLYALMLGLDRGCQLQSLLD